MKLVRSFITTGHGTQISFCIKEDGAKWFSGHNNKESLQK
jgi:hypothetical protein